MSSINVLIVVIVILFFILIVVLTMIGHTLDKIHYVLKEIMRRLATKNEKF